MGLLSSLMSILPFEWAHYGFMQNALLAVLIVTPLLAFLGCMVVNNQMAFFSDAIGHSALTGIAIGAILGIANPLWSMLVFAFILAIGITFLRRYSAASSDTVIGIVMSFTVALGIVILSRGGGFNKYSRFLIGDLLSITPHEIAGLCAVAIVFVVLWITSFNRIFLGVAEHFPGAQQKNAGLVCSGLIRDDHRLDCHHERSVGRDTSH